MSERWSVWRMHSPITLHRVNDFILGFLFGVPIGVVVAMLVLWMALAIMNRSRL